MSTPIEYMSAEKSESLVTHMQSSSAEYTSLLQEITTQASLKYATIQAEPVHPSPLILKESMSKIVHSVPELGCAADNAITHLIHDICPALSNSPSPKYFGFVTGGATPAAQLADLLTTIYDQNVQVHLPQCSVSTTVEAAVLKMILELLKLSVKEWPGRTLTTGATASNVLGLACGRNWVLSNLGIDVGEDGFCGKVVQIICASAHASIRKAASIIGIGRRNCVEVADPEDPYGVSFDMIALEAALSRNKTNDVGSIVVISLGEVNTGLSTQHVARIRSMCDMYQAWLHIDAAFAIFAGLYEPLAKMLVDLQFGDSLCVDAHKWLNVPYDCAMFFTKHLDCLKNVCGSGPAAYLTSAIVSENHISELGSIESPLHVGIENSRRFRALPLYASLIAYGHSGYSEMIHRNLQFARALDTWLRASDWYEVVSPLPATKIGDNLAAGTAETTNIVLFTIDPHILRNPQEDGKTMTAVIHAINASRKAYVTGTTFQGRNCARIAVSNWRTGLARESSSDACATSAGALRSEEDLLEVTETFAEVARILLADD